MYNPKTPDKEMKADIITIGDEILIGQIIDSNSAWIAQRLDENGFKVREINSVADDKQQIFESLDRTLSKSELVIMTGGLGPTEDDITKECLSEYFDTPLLENRDVLEDIKKYLRSKNFELNPRNMKQALVPRDCRIFRNDNGTAAGMWFNHKGAVLISMPAVPFEMKAMFSDKILPALRKHFNTPKIVHRTILTYGIPESALAEKLSGWQKNLHPKISLAFLPSPERLRLRMSMICENEQKANKILDSETQKLKQIIGPAIFGYGNRFLHEVIGDILKEKKCRLATAESCTGGYIARLITSVPGSSEYYNGSVVAYSNRIKQKVLSVKPETLEKHGAVSKETVKEMVQALLHLFETDYAIAVSGIAGPEGGTDEKPVGTVWIAVGDKKTIFAKKYSFGTKRAINIRLAGSKALDLLRKKILFPEKYQ